MSNSKASPLVPSEACGHYREILDLAINRLNMVGTCSYFDIPNEITKLTSQVKDLHEENTRLTRLLKEENARLARLLEIGDENIRSLKWERDVLNRLLILAQQHEPRKSLESEDWLYEQYSELRLIADRLIGSLPSHSN